MELTETMLALTPVALAPVLALLIRSRTSRSVSPAETVIVSPLIVNASPSVSPRAVVVLAYASLLTLWAVATRRISMSCSPSAAALVTLTPRRLAAVDAVPPSTRLDEAKACLAEKALSLLSKLTLP